MSKLVGFQKYSFNDKDDSSKVVSGTALFISNPVLPEHGKGIKVEKINISDAYLDRVVPEGLESLFNQEVYLQYNKYGKPEYIGKVK